ncbi:unnamed protein product [Camellia sinensis]
MMKTLIEQNQQQARQILIQNPLLTKALFQAQIMLGMVQPPQAIPNIQSTVTQPPTQQPVQPAQQTNVQATHALPGQNGLQDQTSAPQIPKPPPSEFVNASRWYNHIEALLRISGVSGEGCGVHLNKLHSFPSLQQI